MYEHTPEKNVPLETTVGQKIESFLEWKKCIDKDTEFFIEFKFPKTFLFLNSRSGDYVRIFYKERLLSSILIHKRKLVQVEENVFVVIPDRYYDQVRVYLDTQENVLIVQILAIYLLQWIGGR